MSANVAEIWKNLDPYSQLIRSLLPRTASVSVFDANADLRWSTESTTGPDLPHVVQESLQKAQADPSAPGALVDVEC